MSICICWCSNSTESEIKFDIVFKRLKIIIYIIKSMHIVDVHVSYV